MPTRQLINTIEAILFANQNPLSVKAIIKILAPEISLETSDVLSVIEALQTRYDDTGIELTEVASGYRLQTREAYASSVTLLFKEKPQRYSRALLETLALIIYQQPITRGEISDIRGVSVSSNVIRTLEERGWIEVVGQKEVPGRPALFGTTTALLDYLNVKSIADLPPLPDIKSVDQLPNSTLFNQLNQDEKQTLMNLEESQSDDAESASASKQSTL